jgi:transposase
MPVAVPLRSSVGAPYRGPEPSRSVRVRERRSRLDVAAVEAAPPMPPEPQTVASPHETSRGARPGQGSPLRSDPATQGAFGGPDAGCAPRVHDVRARANGCSAGGSGSGSGATGETSSEEAEARVANVSPSAHADGTPARSKTQEMGALEKSAMRKVALDLGARKIAFCEVANGEVVGRATVQSLTALSDRLGPNTPPATVLFEAGRSSWHVHDKLVAWGHQPLMLDTTRAKQLGIGQHRRKTDRIDAETLARALEAGRVPLAHVLSPHRRELRFHLSVRRALVEARAQFVTSVRELARAQGHLVPTCPAYAFAAKLKTTPLDEVTRAVVAPLAVVIEQLDAQIVVADAKLDQLSAKEPIITVLKTAPGVACVVAAAFVSVLDEAGRFRNAHQVEAYLGLVPSEDSSGGRRKIGAITKQGNGYLRALLTQSAWAILRGSDDPLKLWAEGIAQRRGKRIAVIALSRRLVGVLWAMWRRNAVYDPRRVGLASARGTEHAAEDLAHRARALKKAATKGRRGRNPKTVAVSQPMA